MTEARKKGPAKPGEESRRGCHYCIARNRASNAENRPEPRWTENAIREAAAGQMLRAFRRGDIGLRDIKALAREGNNVAGRVLDLIAEVSS